MFNIDNELISDLGLRDYLEQSADDFFTNLHRELFAKHNFNPDNDRFFFAAIVDHLSGRSNWSETLISIERITGQKISDIGGEKTLAVYLYQKWLQPMLSEQTEFELIKVAVEALEAGFLLPDYTVANKDKNTEVIKNPIETPVPSSLPIQASGTSETNIQTNKLSLNPIQSVISGNTNRDILENSNLKTTKDEVEHFTNDHQAEIQQYEVKSQNNATLDYYAFLASAIKAIPSWLSLPEDTRQKISILLDRRIRALSESYDFRARVQALVGMEQISQGQAAEILAAGEVAFSQLHQAEQKNNSVTANNKTPVLDPMAYSLEQSIAERKSSMVKSESANADKIPTSSLNPLPASPVKTDQSQIFVAAVKNNTPITILPSPDREISEPAIPPLKNDIPFVARIPTWQEKLHRDVKPPKAQLLTPVDEIRTMTIAEWRRLGQNPQKAAQRIREKIELLGQEAMDKRVEALRAWKQTEMYRQYVDIGTEVMRTGQSVPEVIASMQTKNALSGSGILTAEEWTAILALNSNLRFA